MAGELFATAVNCIDGRAQIPIIEFVRSEASVDFVDLITEPGVVRVLSSDENAPASQSVKERIHVSITKHSSDHIWVAAHHDCAANPVDEATQKQQTHVAVKLIQQWFPKARVSGLWVNPNFEAERI